MEVEVWEGLSHPHPQLEWCALGGGDSGLLPSPVSHLSSSPWTSRRKNYPLHPPAPRPPALFLTPIPAGPLTLSRTSFSLQVRKAWLPSQRPRSRSSRPSRSHAGPLQPSLLPPPRFHSIDFCCMSTLITAKEKMVQPRITLRIFSEAPGEVVAQKATYAPPKADPFRVPALLSARPLGQPTRNLILSCRHAPTSLWHPHPAAPR